MANSRLNNEGSRNLGRNVTSLDWGMNQRSKRLSLLGCKKREFLKVIGLPREEEEGGLVLGKAPRIKELSK